MIVNANALQIPLADRSVQMVVTSPPYFALRDYGVSGQIGLEQTPAEYLVNMVAVFREVWRVLRDDGTCWVNIGDSYVGSPPGNYDTSTSTLNGAQGQTYQRRLLNKDNKNTRLRPPGLKPKDMIGIPWRLAFALQEDGWYLRSDIIWSKPNPMPESVTDRPTKAHEYLFLLTKRERYFFDAEAIKEPAIGGWNGSNFDGEDEIEIYKNNGRKSRKNDGQGTGGNGSKIRDHVGNSLNNPDGTRNRRTVWTIPTEPTPYAHFATYPRALVEPCIKAGTSERGCCPRCGKAWVRMVEPSERYAAILGEGYHDHSDDLGMGMKSVRGSNKQNKMRDAGIPGKEMVTLGWRPSCDCGTSHTIPCVVLDPFAGSGTTGVVCQQLGRRFVGLDLSYPYLHDIAKRRLSMTALEEWEHGVKTNDDGYHDLPLFGGSV